MHFDFNPGHPTLWVFVAVLLFFAALIYWKIPAKINAALDKRSAEIKDELDEARRLREEAQALLASYQRKQKEAEEQAEAIVKQARHDAEVMAENARKALKERLERRGALAESKIATAEAQALADVRARAVDIAMQAAEQVIRKDTSSASLSRIVDEGIAQMPKTLN